MEYNATRNADLLGLSYSDYNFLMALSGLFLGLLVVFYVSSILLNLSKGS